MDPGTTPAHVTSSPPPPPPPPSAPQARTSGGRPSEQWRAPVAGQLTSGWRIVTGIVWALSIVGFVAVWKTSTELGLNTWWLGPFGNPHPVFIQMLPFLPPLAMVLLVVNNFRWLPWAGLGAAGLTALVGVFDLSKVTRLGIVELAIAAAGGLTAVAGFAGRYRP